MDMEVKQLKLLPMGKSEKHLNIKQLQMLRYWKDISSGFSVHKKV
jgi:hypothetical protein